MKYKIIKNLITKDNANLLYKYLVSKDKILKTFLESKFIDSNTELFGMFGDKQVDDAYAIYGDPLFEVVLEEVKSEIEKVVEYKLYENFAYSRLYKKGNELKIHTDRSACELAISVHLGGFKWSIYIDDEEINLDQGDAVIYDGAKLKHYRKPLEDKNCGQLFLFYSKNKDEYLDKRPHLGLPKTFVK